MNRLKKNWFKLLIIGLPVIVLVVLVFLHNTHKGVKHIIIISMDTTRADHLSCYGYKKKTTPFIDKMAEQGILYEKMFSHVGLTLPMHSSIMTGLTPASHGVHLNNMHRLHQNKTTLAELLGAKKYQTAAFISSFILNRRFGIAQGFRTYQDSFIVSRQGAPRLPVERQATETGSEAIKWMKKNKNKPYFLWVHFYDPHFTYDPPEPFKSAFKENAYDGEIAYTDFWIGKIWQELKKQGDDYVIIVTADHGDSFGEHKEITHGFFAYQACLSIPLIIHSPHLPQGKRVSYPVRSIDIAPTVCKLADLPIPREMEGIDLLGQEGEDPKLGIYQESWTPTGFNWSAITAWIEYPWKYIDVPKPELYNLQDDPTELQNRIEEFAKIADRLKKKLRDYLEKRDRKTEVSTVELDPETIKQLRSLGYISGKITADDMIKSLSQADPKDKIDVFRDYQRAQGFIADKQYEKGLEFLRKIAESEPALPKVHLDLAQTYNDAKMYDEALNEALIVSKLDPSIPDSLVLMGEIEIKRGKTTEGISHFKNALKKFPKNILIRSRLGEIYASEKEYSDAEKYFKGALKFAPRNPYLLNNLGYIYIMKDNNFEEGIALIRKADRLRPNNGYIKESLGWALYRFGKYEEALKTLEQAHSLLGSTPRLLSHLEDTYKALNMPDKVQEIQKLAEQLKENDGDNDSE